MITMLELMGYGNGGGAREDAEQATPRRQAAVPVGGDDGRREVAGQGQQKASPSASNSKYGRAVVSVLNNRAGHARFRRGPVAPEPAPAGCPGPPDDSDDSARYCDGRLASLSASASASSSFPSSAATTTGEGSVSNGRGGRKRPPPANHPASDDHARGLTRSCDAGHNGAGHATHGGGRCRCTKKRKPRVRRSIRLPAISSKNADIPPDDYSWRKYGQKPIKGSPYPRGYYKCSTVRGCPARKHVERDPGEPAMLIVTYEGDHRHGGDDVVAGAGVPKLTTA